jgi:hypothetical protein
MRKNGEEDVDNGKFPPAQRDSEGVAVIRMLDELAAQRATRRHLAFDSVHPTSEGWPIIA